MIKDVIFRKALAILNVDYTKITQTEDNPIEKQYCEDNIETACSTASTSRDWYWLVDTKNFTTQLENESYRGLKYGYAVPDDFLKPYLTGGKYNCTYARKGKKIFFDVQNPIMDYIVDVSKKLEESSWDYPTPFVDLIAALLAMSIAPMIVPEGTFGQNAQVKMQTALSACIDLQKDSSRDYIPSPKEYLP